MIQTLEKLETSSINPVLLDRLDKLLKDVLNFIDKDKSPKNRLLKLKNVVVSNGYNDALVEYHKEFDIFMVDLALRNAAIDEGLKTCIKDGIKAAKTNTFLDITRNLSDNVKDVLQEHSKSTADYEVSRHRT